jgi:signal transduction histidine kinase
VSSILVLDDRATERDLLSTVLTYAGHTVVQAPSGEEALDLARANRPELIIADLMMPDMNGYEFVRELRADPLLANARVVFCTATYDQDEVRELAESCGVSHTLVKPCEPEEIIRVVSEVLGSDQAGAAHMVTEQFDREELWVLNTKLIQKVDELELAKRLVEEKAEQLAVSLQHKLEFFSNMSNELRTPLNSLLILAGELKANPGHNLTDTQVQYASVIESSGSDLLGLLNDLLDLAKIESGTVTLEIAELPLLELQQSLEHEFRHVADQRGVIFSVDLSTTVTRTIATDPRRLRQVLKNLIANAFKFTEQGEVNVRVSRANSGWSSTNRELARAGEVTAFSISDTGIGIAAESQTSIFEAFAQADGTTARQYGGTGLGLSISRQLVQLLGGEMALSSTLGEGSTFTVYLPSTHNGDAGAAIPRAADALDLQPAPSAPQAPATRPSAPPRLPATAGLAGKRVLVVDDDFRNIFAITALLERSEMDVISAESGKESIAILERTPDVDFAVVDIMMPVMNGYDTMRAIRKLPGLGRLPIVALTAKTGSGERERCIEAGASAYLPKPLEADLLLIFLRDYLPAGAAEGRASRVLV